MSDPSDFLAQHTSQHRDLGTGIHGDPAARMQGRKGKLQALGRQAVSTLYMLLRNVRMYDAENAIFSQPLAALRETINTVLAAEGRFELTAVGTALSLNGMTIQVDFSSLENVRHLTNEMKSRDMGGLSVTRPVQVGELKAFLRAFAAVDTPLDERTDGMVSMKIGKYRAMVEQLQKRADAEIDQTRNIDRRRYALTIYARTVHFMQGYLRAVQQRGALPSTSPGARLVRELVDVTREQKQQLLGVTTTALSREYLAYHSVNACLLSVVLGMELGLTREQLYDLRRAALFHDIGAAAADQSILQKPAALTREEREQMNQNPLIAAKIMLRTRPLDFGSLKCILAAHEAKQPYFHASRDANGQAKYTLRDVGVFGRIIRLVATYDALTSARPYRTALAPEDALMAMSTQLRFELDPFLLSTFTKLLAGRSAQQMHGATFSPL